MAIDRPEDGDSPVAATELDDADADAVGADESDAGIDHAPQVLGEPSPAGAHLPDSGERYDYHAEYRATVDAVYLAAARERWEAAKPGLKEEWRQYADEHPAPPRERPGVDEQAAAQVEQGCKEIRETEENIVTPAMTRIEAEDPERRLVGLEYRCKGQDRIAEKVARQIESQPHLTAAEALTSVKDAIRYTFQYTEDDYIEKLDADANRLKASGFELVELRNSWGREEYKGINSRWRVPGTAQLFEVQFHTQTSFEAKQLTHPAYERLRFQATAKAERDQLESFQRRVNAYVPVPRGALVYPDYA